MSTKPSKREILRKKRQAEKRRKTIIITVVAIGAIFLISLAAFVPNLIGGRSAVKESQGFSVGDPDAPVSVVNFSSFSCGFCENFSKTVEPGFIKDYVDTGRVYYRYVNLAFSSDEGTQNAAKAAYCAAEQNRFFDYRSYLYSAARVQDGFSTGNLISMASSAGLEQDTFSTCLLEDNTYQDAIAADLSLAQSVGVTGTPSFLVNGQLVFSNDLIPLVESLLNQ